MKNDHMKNHSSHQQQNTINTHQTSQPNQQPLSPHSSGPNPNTTRLLDKLKQELSQCRYRGSLDPEKVFKGHPSVFLPIINFFLVTFSKPVAQYIYEKGYEFSTQNDFHFLTSIYEILNQLFTYKPPFTIDQFFAYGNCERKLQFILEIISLVKSKNAILNKRSSSQKPKSVTFKEEEEAENQKNAQRDKQNYQSQQQQQQHQHNGTQNNSKLDIYSTINPNTRGSYQKNELFQQAQPQLQNQQIQNRERQSSGQRPRTTQHNSNNIATSQSQYSEPSEDKHQNEAVMKSPKFHDQRPQTTSYQSRSRQQQPLSTQQNISQPGSQSSSIMMKHFTGKPPVISKALGQNQTSSVSQNLQSSIVVVNSNSIPSSRVQNQQRDSAATNVSTYSKGPNQLGSPSGGQQKHKNYTNHIEPDLQTKVSSQQLKNRLDNSNLKSRKSSTNYQNEESGEQSQRSSTDSHNNSKIFQKYNERPSNLNQQQQQQQQQTKVYDQIPQQNTYRQGSSPNKGLQSSLLDSQTSQMEKLSKQNSDLAALISGLHEYKERMHRKESGMRSNSKKRGTSGGRADKENDQHPPISPSHHASNNLNNYHQYQQLSSNVVGYQQSRQTANFGVAQTNLINQMMADQQVKFEKQPGQHSNRNNAKNSITLCQLNGGQEYEQLKTSIDTTKNGGEVIKQNINHTDEYIQKIAKSFEQTKSLLNNIQN
ncbi:centrosomal protein of 44 kda-like [Stylonychia lemnae]|uniref:Centrosomal protein of 44 kDa n=1 Tax=Stylonychia lemnae TaxID=5949 RepID=A0A077ZTX1_STYLE|nr:centrosomal protein of 44 kda-like [Stylonychia lemnae]|eukprot:CDW73312.1 centrosomal protein of 44 kda-like [Stylonychia lemnae]